MHKNNFLIGLVASLIASCFGLLVLYVLKFMPSNIELTEFIELIKNESQFRSGVLSLALLANIPLFYWCQRRKLMRSAYGIALVVFIVALLVVLSKTGVL
jgi:hypothetical protein